MAAPHLFSSESVTEGHPDKLADQISDAILDAMIAGDKHSRVAVETLVTTGLCIVAGEVTTKTYAEIPQIVRNTIEGAGYADATLGFDYETVGILASIRGQSKDIALGVDEREGHEQGAGDQGLMFGFACEETPVLMPAPIFYAHKIVRELAAKRRSGEIPWLRPDGKSQITIEYEGHVPKRIHTVVVSVQHDEDVSIETIRKVVLEEIIKPVLPAELLDDNVVYHVNPTGRFVTGGPRGDTGLTGRKIIVDTYGGYGSHGGGCFSGKDPSKVDRSASYMARHIAKNVVASGVAERCEIQLAYAIGLAEPVSVFVDTEGTGKVPDIKIRKSVRELFPLKPKAIIEYLDLLRPIYKKTAAYGHFGREEEDFTWEKTHRADDVRQALGL